MMLRLAACHFPPEELGTLRLLLSSGYEIVAMSLDAEGESLADGQHAAGPGALSANMVDGLHAAILRVGEETAFELTRRLRVFRQCHPTVPAILVHSTRREIPLSLVLHHRIHNILLAETAFNDGGHQLCRTLYMMHDPVWGLHLENIAGHDWPIVHREIRSRADKTAVGIEMIEYLHQAQLDPGAISHVEVSLEETINNGIFHAFRDDRGRERYHVSTFDTMTGNDALQLAWTLMGHRVIFSVTDNAGTLSLQVLADRLIRGDTGVNHADERGRGLYLLRALCAEVVYTVWPGRLSQTLVVIDSPAQLSRSRPLFINVIDAAHAAEAPQPPQAAVELTRPSALGLDS